MTEGEADIVLSTDSYVLQHRDPVQKYQLVNPLSQNEVDLDSFDGHWFYQKHIFDVRGSSGLSRSDLQIRIKHKLYSSSAHLAELMKITRTDRILSKHEQMQMETERISQEVRDYEISGKEPVISRDCSDPQQQRKAITKSVRIFVWQRDGGKCSQCESRENLEFDHIIPISKGGSNTERNIQILCETCNRRKSAKI